MMQDMAELYMHLIPILKFEVEILSQIQLITMEEASILNVLTTIIVIATYTIILL